MQFSIVQRAGKIFLAVGILSVFSGCQSGESPSEVSMTKQEFDQVQVGMDHKKVAEIIGDPGKEIGKATAGGSTTVNYVWGNPDGSAMMGMFKDGKLVTKNQSGLK